MLEHRVEHECLGVRKNASGTPVSRINGEGRGVEAGWSSDNGGWQELAGPG